MNVLLKYFFTLKIACRSFLWFHDFSSWHACLWFGIQAKLYDTCRGGNNEMAVKWNQTRVISPYIYDCKERNTVTAEEIHVHTRNVRNELVYNTVTPVKQMISIPGVWGASSPTLLYIYRTRANSRTGYSRILLNKHVLVGKCFSTKRVKVTRLYFILFVMFTIVHPYFQQTFVNGIFYLHPSLWKSKLTL